MVEGSDVSCRERTQHISTSPNCACQLASGTCVTLCQSKRTTQPSNCIALKTLADSMHYGHPCRALFL